MKKLIIKLSTILLINSLLFLLPYNYPLVYAQSNSDIELYTTGDFCNPPHFRLDTQNNISGSGQFSKSGLDTIIKAIPEKYEIIDIDLREEPHGYVNSSPINWERFDEGVNKDMTVSEVMKIEKVKLDSIKIDSPLTYYNLPCKTVIPKIVINEKSLIVNNKLTYKRFPVKDGSLPNENIVNDFVKFVKTQPKNSWLHFHCKEGIGRTTTFMIMYDILKNGKDKELNDLITNQIILANMDVDEIKGFLTAERIEFFNNFYNTYA